MEEAKMLKILDTVRALLEKDNIFEAKEYLKIEIENIKGLTEQRCKGIKNYLDNVLCKYCSNINCNNNKNSSC